MQTQERHKRLWIWTLVTGVLLAVVVGLPTHAQAGNDYPYPDGDPSELDERGFYYRHCTSFAAWRMAQRGEFHNYMQGGHWWHARHWADNAQSLGFVVDTTPAPGSIAHWYAGEGGADSLGHVAVVESVNADGSVIVEEYNGTSSLAYSRRGPIHAPRYIHVYDDAPASTVPADTAPVVEAKSNLVSRSASVRTVTAGVSASEVATTDRAPSGHLIAPPSDAELASGQTVTVAGVFEDDSRVTKVRFFVADDRYRWTEIGTDAHGGNGTYSVNWKVSYPAGSRINVYAEAFDDSGQRAVESIQGLEGIVVVPGEAKVTVRVRPDVGGEVLGGMSANASQAPAYKMGMLPLLGVAILVQRRRVSARARAARR